MFTFVVYTHFTACSIFLKVRDTLIDEIHIFCLHYVFTPRINSCLEKFIQGWDNHPIEGTGNLTPNQHWIRGLFRVANHHGTIAKEVWENLSEVGTVCSVLKQHSLLKQAFDCLISYF